MGGNAVSLRSNESQARYIHELTSKEMWELHFACNRVS